MLCGCIASGETKCDGCSRVIEHGERYLVVEENESKKRFCVDCSLSKGYAKYVKDKSEEVLTFFPSELKQ